MPWKRTRPDGAELLKLIREENGVQRMPAGPERQASGLLLQRTLPYGLTAETRMEFRPEAVRFGLTMPLGPTVLAASRHPSEGWDLRTRRRCGSGR